jgi:xylulokinase
LCDVFGKKVIKPSVTDASYSSAMLAGVGAGIFKDVFDAVDQCVRIEKVYEPNILIHERYNGFFKLYRAIHDNLKNIYKDINQILS